MLEKWKNKQHQLKPFQGQSLIELALLLPFLLFLILGALDIGRMFYIKIVLTNAAREGANYLAYYPMDKSSNPDYFKDPDHYPYKNTYTAIKEEAESSNVKVLTTDISISEDCCTAGLPVEVSITLNVDLVYDSILQSLGLLGGPVQVSSSVKMVVQ